VAGGAASTWLAGLLGGVVFAAATRNPLMLALAAVGPVTALCGALVDRAAARRRRRRAAGEGSLTAPVPGRRLGRAGRRRSVPHTGAMAGAVASAADLRTAVLAALAAPAAPGAPAALGAADALDAQDALDARVGAGTEGRWDDAAPSGERGPVAGLRRLAPDGCVAVVGPRGRALAVARLLAAAELTAALAAGAPSVRVDLRAPAGEPDPWSWCRWVGGLAPGPAGATLLLVDTVDRGPGTSSTAEPGTTERRGAPPTSAVAPGPGARRRRTVLLVADDVARVPAWCRTRVQLGDGPGGDVVTRGDGTTVTAALSGVSVAWADRQARLVAAWAARAGDGTQAPGPGDGPGTAVLPATVALADLPGIPPPDADAVLDAWGRGASTAPPHRRDGLQRGGPEGGLEARLGVGVSGPVLLDLVRDGPHALVAGTTGAGKSELLQTWVLSLALTRSPAELAVLLVDYKGGAGLGACLALPHVVGQVTDLDPALAARALTGLRAELRRRERLLAAWGAADLASLRARAPDAAPPRLLVVVDEFRALLDDLPGFVPDLLRVAAQGRSLGVHLLLATQRPGGAVGPDLRANLAVRVCLRVTDSADSVDVLDVPDAARIPPRPAGRALVRSGPGALEPLQVALAEAPPSGVAVRVRRADGRRPVDGGAGSTPGTAPVGAAPPAVRTRAWVDAALTAARRAGLTTPDVPWLPELPGLVPLAALRTPADGRPDAREAAPGPRRAPVTTGPDEPLEFALGDRPAQQRRDVVAWRPWTGPLLVVGASASGRTTTLRTLATVALGQGWQVHTVSAGRPLLAGTAHPALGTCASADDPRLVARLLTVLAAAERAGHDDVAHLLLVDGLDAVLEMLAAVARGRAADRMVELLRDGRRRGVCVAATAPPALSAGLATHFADRLVLRVGDTLADRMAGVPAELVGGRRPAGRAVWLPAARDGSAAGAPDGEPQDPAGHGTGGAMLCQVAVGSPPASVGPPSATGDAPATRAAAPVRLRPVPHRVRLADLAGGDVGAAGADLPAVSVGVGGDDGGPVRLALDRGALVTGPPGSGRSTALAVVVHGLLAHDVAMLVVARDGALRDLADRRLPERTCGFTARENDLAIDALLRQPGRDRPAVLVVDDLDALEQVDPAASMHLMSLLARDRATSRPVVLVASARTATACLSFRGALGELRTVRRGLVLGAQEAGSSDVFGVDVAWDTDPARPHDPGRGVVVHGRRTSPVQVARLDHAD
jgi:S-DNA-T family DNA segregation ATPase FtsK/SpoIIIE